MKRVMFICSGNIFRSVTAQRALSKEVGLRDADDSVVADSAGTNTAQAVMRPDLMNAWKSQGLCFDDPRPRQVTKELLERASVVITMGCDHQDLIWERFGMDSYLFNQIAYGRNEPVLDVSDIFEYSEINSDAATTYIEKTVRYIISATPYVFQGLNRIWGKV